MIRFVLKHGKKSSIMLFLINASIGMVVPINLVVLQRIIDAAVNIEENSSAEVMKYICVFLILQVGSVVLKQSGEAIRVVLSNKLELSFGEEMLRKCSEIEYIHFEEKETYEVIDRLINKTGSNIAAAIDIIATGLRITVSLGGVLLYILKVDPRILIVVLISALPIWFFSVRANLKEGNSYRSFYGNFIKAKYLSNVINSRETIKEGRLYNYYEYISSTWKDHLKVFQDGQVKSNLKPRYIAGGFVFLQFVFITCMIYILLIPLGRGDIEIGVLIAVAEALRHFTGGFQYEIIRIIKQIHIFKKFDEDYNIIKGLKKSEGYLEYTNENGSFSTIQFRDVWFKYGEGEEYVLKNINFTIESEKVIALVGKNGSGKSTVIKLMLGLLKPTEGEVLIDGMAISDIDPHTRKKVFSVIFQDFARYNISLKENIGIAKWGESVSDEEIKNVLQLINRETTIVENLRDGTDSILGKSIDSGSDLSGGEWQSVAIARALIANTSWFIMDEPTSALDPIAEAELYKKLDQLTKDRTAIFVTHRLGSTRYADMILTLDNGSLVESGTHHELMEIGGEYAEMFETQRQWYR